MAVSKEDVIDFIANMTVLELSELIKELEEKFGVSHPTVAGILKRLESKELVRTSVNEKDRRRKDVLLTSKGGEYAMKFRIDCRDMEKTLTEHLSEDECREFCRMLDVICANARKVNQAMESQEEGAENG